MNRLRMGLIVLLLCLLCAQLFGGEIPYEVPEQIRNLPPAQYVEVIKMHNEAQYQQAAERAFTGTQVTVGQTTSTTDTFGGVLYNAWNYVGAYFQTPTFSNRTETTSSRTYDLNRYGGGPVWIVNPYVRQK